MIQKDLSRERFLQTCWNNSIRSDNFAICLPENNLNELSLINESPRGKTNNVVSEQVRHKPACTATEAG